MRRHDERQMKLTDKPVIRPRGEATPPRESFKMPPFERIVVGMKVVMRGEVKWSNGVVFGFDHKKKIIYVKLDSNGYIMPVTNVAGLRRMP